MTAKDILSIQGLTPINPGNPEVDAEMSVIDVIPRLLDSPQRVLTVTNEGQPIGVIDQTSLLEGIGRMIAPRDDCSIITAECRAEDFCASVISHAVEDTDAHLVDMISSPADNGKIRVLLRVRHSDPSAAARSLERYDYEVLETHSSGADIQSLEIATERLLALQALMNV